MALERGKLSNVVQVAAGTTVGIITCESSKKVYVKSIITHAAGTGIATATGQVYFVPNGGTAGPTDQNVCDKVEFATIGNAVDWGDLAQAVRDMGSASNAHGGL